MVAMLIIVPVCINKTNSNNANNNSHSSSNNANNNNHSSNDNNNNNNNNNYIVQIAASERWLSTSPRSADSKKGLGCGEMCLVVDLRS